MLKHDLQKPEIKLFEVHTEALRQEELLMELDAARQVAASFTLGNFGCGKIQMASNKSNTT
jgi:hypothetical protein